MIVIKSRAPLRLGLAGGGTDVSPYCDTYGGLVLNAAIDRYAYAVISTPNESTISFYAGDGQIRKDFPLRFPLLCDGILPLHVATYNYIISNYNKSEPISLKLSTFCDAPIGSGLGSSSTLVVAMIRAFAELLNLPIDDYATAQMAYQIERVDCGFQGGRQDQYSASFGGINFMEFYKEDRAVINQLRIKNWIICELESSILLYFTGVSRESAHIIADQSGNVTSGRQSALEAMHGIRREALTAKECLLRGDFSGLVESMKSGWRFKKGSSKVISNQYIESVFDDAIGAGALAGKISGAGGGGFMIFFVPTEKRMDVVRVLAHRGGQVSNCHFVKNGSQAWRVQ